MVSTSVLKYLRLKTPIFMPESRQCFPYIDKDDLV